MAQETKTVRISEAQYKELEKVSTALNQTVPQALSSGIENLLEGGVPSFIPNAAKEAMKSEV